MFQKLLITIFVLSMIALIGGCGNDSTSGKISDISEEFSGFEPNDEEPAFGSEVIAAEMSDDTEFDDPILSAADVESAIDDDNADIYALRIVWGQMRFDSTVTEVTDWSGSLTVSRGAEVLRRLIRFEDDQDYIVERTDYEKIEWISFTTVHHDGIFVNVIIPKLDESTESTPETITFSTAPFEITFDVTELASLDSIYILDDSNAVAFHAFKVKRMSCPKGFLAGRWGKDDDGENVFYGKWLSHHNILKGHLSGTWEDNKFYGKYIDKLGQFEGLIKGRYHSGHSSSPRHRHAGWFRGYYYDGDGSIIGVLKGHYRENPKESGMGNFFGRWKHYCGQIPEIDDGMDD